MTLVSESREAGGAVGSLGQFRHNLLLIVKGRNSAVIEVVMREWRDSLVIGVMMREWGDSVVIGGLCCDEGNFNRKGDSDGMGVTLV